MNNLYVIEYRMNENDAWVQHVSSRGRYAYSKMGTAKAVLTRIWKNLAPHSIRIIPFVRKE